MFSAGVLIVYNNYTGDRLNFGQAIERAKNEGIKVDSVVVGEDCAMMSKDKTTGRRGLAGSAIIMKVCSMQIYLVQAIFISRKYCK